MFDGARSLATPSATSQLITGGKPRAFGGAKEQGPTGVVSFWISPALINVHGIIPLLRRHDTQQLVLVPVVRLLFSLPLPSALQTLVTMSSSVATSTLTQRSANTPKAAPSQPKEQDSKHDDFFWTYTEEPHATRRQAIIKANPEVHIT